MPSKTAQCVLAAPNDIAYKMPFPMLGVDSDNGSEFINVYLLQWCERHRITFTRARPPTRTTAVTSSRRTGRWSAPWSATTATTPPQNCCSTRSGSCSPKLTNYFYPQQKLMSKVRDGAKVSKKYDTAATPFHRVIDHPTMTDDRIAALAIVHGRINPAATQRRIQALTNQIRTLTTSKAGPKAKTRVATRAHQMRHEQPNARTFT